MSAAPLLEVARQIRRPTFIYTAGGNAQAEAFDNLHGLAQRVVAIADTAVGLTLSAQAWPCAYPGLDLFFAWSVYARRADGSRDWIGSAAILDAPASQLQAALDAALGGRRAAA